MKKLICILSAMAVFLVFGNVCGALLTVGSAEPVTQSKSISGSWRSAKYNFCDMIHGEDGLMTFGENPQNVPLENMIYVFSEELDLYDIEEIQFRFENNTGLPVTFTNAGAKAAVTTSNNEGIVDNDLEFWNNYPGFVYMLNGHDFNLYPFYVKADGSDEWELADRTSYGPDPAIMTIPAGFKGTVKMVLCPHDQQYDDGSHRISRGFGLTMQTGVAGGDIEPQDYSGKTMKLNQFTATVAEEIVVYPTPAAPEGVAATDCTTADNNDGTITGVDDTMEYSRSGGAWIAVPSGASTVTGLSSGIYQVRVKAVDPYPAGNTVTVRIAEWTSPDMVDYVKVIEDFEDMEDISDVIKGVEYTFLGGTDWFACDNTDNNSTAVKQELFGSEASLQKTFITTELGDLSRAEFVQMYLKWDGDTDLCLAGAVGASMSTPSWYHWMEQHVDNWNGEQDPSKFWNNYILVQGNTGALCSVSDAIKQAYYQDGDGKWIESESTFDGAIIPAGYTGYIRFRIPENRRYDDVPFGFGWTLFDPTHGDIEGTMVIDDIALVLLSANPVEGLLSFADYLQAKGAAADPGESGETGNQEPSGQTNEPTGPADTSTPTDTETPSGSGGSSAGNGEGDAQGNPENPDTGSKAVIPMIALAVISGAAALTLSKKRGN